MISFIRFIHIFFIKKKFRPKQNKINASNIFSFILLFHFFIILFLFMRIYLYLVDGLIEAILSTSF